MENKDPESYNLMYYHPSVWNHLGFPNDTFAVHFMKNNLWLSFFLQIIFVLFILSFAFMAIFMAYINIFEGGISKKIENDRKEF